VGGDQLAPSPRDGVWTRPGRLDGAIDSARAVEGRAVTEVVRGALGVGGLPRPNATAVAAFAASVAAWLEALGRAIAVACPRSKPVGRARTLVLFVDLGIDHEA
jgi:hypothetical protein